MTSPSYLLIAADKSILVGSYEAGLTESKKHGKCRLYRLELIDVLNANKAGQQKPAEVEVEEQKPAAKKKAKAK